MLRSVPFTPDESMFDRVYRFAIARPFLPFTLVLNSGARIPVATHDHIFFLRNPAGEPYRAWFIAVHDAEAHDVPISAVSDVITDATRYDQAAPQSS